MTYDNDAQIATDDAAPAGSHLAEPAQGVPVAEPVSAPQYQRLDGVQPGESPPPDGYAQSYVPQPGYVPQQSYAPPQGYAPQGYDVQQGYLQPGVSPAPVKKRNRGVLILAAVLGVALIAAGGVFAFTQLSATHRPAEALPASGGVYIEVNLEPGVDQLVAGAALLQKMPQLKDAQGNPIQIDASKTPKEQLFNLLARNVMRLDVTYADVEPWLGDRVGVTMLPGASAADQTPLAVAVAVKDSAAAMKSLPALLAKSSTTQLTATPVGDRFVVITKNSDAATFADELRAGTFAEDANFKRVTGTTDKTKIMSFYTDAAKAVSLAGKVTNQTVSTSAAQGVATGSLNLTADYAELTSDGVDGQKVELKTGAYEMAAAVGGSPSVVMTVSDSAWVIDQVWANLTSDQQRTLVDGGRSFGLAVPDDVRAMFGEGSTIAMFGVGQTFGLVAKGAQPDQAKRPWGGLSGTLAGACPSCAPLDIAVEGDRVSVAYSPYGGAYVEASDLLRGSQLSANTVFTKAVPSGPANVVMFVDTSSLTALSSSMPKLGIGLTSTSNKDGQSHGVFRVVPLG